MAAPGDYGTIPGSFRDPSGFLFKAGGKLYRQVNLTYKEDYDFLMDCGLYEALTQAGLLVHHREIEDEGLKRGAAYKIIQPELIPFISYPYEWCFSQLRDAALITLEIQSQALECGMSLKDCSAYNVQFKDGKPIFIDTLSFERYQDGTPWVAYRQFCQHFLAPLALMSYKDIRMSQLLRANIDGIPLDLASRLLPFRTRFAFSLLTHIHLHAKSQKRYADKETRETGHHVRRISLLGLIDSLKGAVKRLKWQPKGTEWVEYYSDTNYSPETLNRKKELVAQYFEEKKAKMVWDLGANVGLFSRVAADKGIETIAFDIDPACVELNYIKCSETNEIKILPLLLDLTNPPPAIGWHYRERMSIIERGPADTVLALALIHHLAISNNLPLDKIADFFSKICQTLIIEFVPKNDSKVQKLLASREDIFPDYTQAAFEKMFQKFFSIRASEKIEGTERTLYLMEKRKPA